MHVLNLLASIPAYSGVRCVQLLPLATAAFELRIDRETSYSDVKIASFRDFVIERLDLLAGRLPLKPISRMMQLLTRVVSGSVTILSLLDKWEPQISIHAANGAVFG